MRGTGLHFSYNAAWARICELPYLCRMRILALDYGLKRTGIAATDELQLIASGLTTVESPKLLDFLSDYFGKEKVAKVLIGEPKQMNYTDSQSAPLIEKFVAAFKAKFPDMEVVRVDERFTSKLAFQAMIDGGLGKKRRQDKALVDEISAVIMLQDYLRRS